MATEVISDRPARLRDYRCAGELLSLVLTFTFLLSLYGLATVFFPATWSSTVKALLITMAGLTVYVISVKLQQRAAFGTLVRVSPRQFSELYQLSAKAAERLSHAQVPLYVKRSSEMNIYTIGLWQQPIIVLTSSLIDQMEPGNLQFFIGREIGHVAAGHIWLRTLLKPLGADVPVIGKLLNSVVFGDWINRTEYTADRAGFIACRSLTTAISTMLKFGVGVRLFEKLDIKEYLDQINEVRNVRGHLTEIVAEQPYLTQRVRSLVRFSLSAQYKSLAPEKTSNTKILKAIPDQFVTSGIGRPELPGFADVAELAELAKLDEIATVSQQNKVTERETRRPTVRTVDPVAEAPGPGATETEDEDAITITDLASAIDENAPDPRLSLLTADGRMSYTLRRRTTRIGRNNENDIVLDSDRVSRHHAEILCDGGPEGDAFSIVDKGSRNGIWVNRQRIKGTSALKSGDAIRIGRLEFTFLVKEDLKD
jgi:Zn-dependent protease with chaperone function